MDNSPFIHGEITSWKFRNDVVYTYGKYAIRFTLTFADGYKLNREKGGFKTQRECLECRDKIITELNNHHYVPYRVKVEDFFDYWLNEYMVNIKKVKYQTFITYRSLVSKRIVPYFSGRYISSITSEELFDFLKSFLKTENRPLKACLVGAFDFANSINLVRYNVAVSALKTFRKSIKKEIAEEPNNYRPVLSEEQIQKLFIACKQTEPDLYLPLLIAVTTGCRISELIAITFNDVDVNNNTVHIDKQLGRIIGDEKDNGKFVTKQVISTKTFHGNREVVIPTFVTEEIVKEWAKFKEESKIVGYDQTGYIWRRPNGVSHGRQDYSKPFNRLKHSLGLPDNLHWHDLRHSYSTVMLLNNATLKDISTNLGHSNPIFSLQKYIDANSINAVGMPEMNSFIKSIGMDSNGNFDEGVLELIFSDELLSKWIPF